MLMEQAGQAVSKWMGTVREAEDYTGEDGLLYCGKCHTPRQVRIGVDPRTGRPGETIAPTLCRCRQEADRAEEERERNSRFAAYMRTLNAEGAANPNALRHTFADDDGQNPEISAVCRRYVEHWEEMAEKNVGILFYGTVGAGKTFYASCIANALLERRVRAACTSFPRLLNLLQGAQDRQKLLDGLDRYHLLVLDDLGAERDSPYCLEQVFGVIEARAQARLPVIVTTNLSMDELEHPPSVQYQRIYDRVLELCPVPLKLTGESRRRRNAAEVKRWARGVLLDG